MKVLNIKYKTSSNRIQDVIESDYSNFLQLHSSELKYMNPWEQHDETTSINNKQLVAQNRLDLETKQNMSVLNHGEDNSK